ncbi:MAG: hypothetical protein ABII12_04525, partial [Planctomycetota bacterium]
TGFGAHSLPCPALQTGLSVSPTSNFDSSGDVGGPFTPDNKIYTLENLSAYSIGYSVAKSEAWVSLSDTAGTLNPSQTTQVTVSINSSANSLPVGRYDDTVTFTNTTDGIGNTARQVDLAVGIPDNCASAITACPGSYSDTTVGMTNDGSASCGDTNTSPDMWYSYTPGSNGTATFSMCTGTSYDAAMSIHSGCPGTTANELACDDDTCSSGGPPEITMSVTAGNTYLIRVTGWSDSAGSFTLQITGPDCGLDALSIGFPGGLPEVIAPGVATPFSVSIEDGTEAYVLGTGTLHYRYDGGTFQTASLIPLGGDLYEATLPPATCTATPEFYISAQGDLGSTITSPSDAPSSVFAAAVGTLTTVMSDDFETDQGWVATNLGATSGDWQRGVPVNDASWDYDPVSDSDGSGQCYLTQNEMGNTDVDDGAVRLASPVIDMSGGNITISYDYYLRLTNTDGTDMLLVEISSNGAAGPWTEIARHDTDGGTGWRSRAITQGDLDTAGVTLTSNMMLRFTANDTGTASINESGLDAFLVTGFTCEETCIADGDMDGVGGCNGNDIQLFVEGLIGTLAWEVECRGDFAAPFGTLEANDIDGMVSALLSGS